MNSALAITNFGNHYIDGHDNPAIQFDFVLKGFNHIIGEIDKNMAEASAKLHEDVPNAPEQLPLLENLDNWQAMKITLEAGIRWAKRYSRLAKIIAENFETDPVRKQELMRIFEICQRVPAEAPEHFDEALQMDHPLQMLKRYEVPETAWPCRPDYWYYPFYKKDVLDDKVMTREDALDYICEFEIRAFEHSRAWSRIYREIMQGSSGPYSVDSRWSQAGRQRVHHL